MTTETRAVRGRARQWPAATEPRAGGPTSGSPVDEFVAVYDGNVDVVMGYFARRCRESQTVADLTSETFVRAVAGFAGFDSRRGSPRSWLFGIATRVFADHCAEAAGHRAAVARLDGHAPLTADEIEELTERIDAERDGAVLMRRFAQLPERERIAVELVDLEGLSPKEAAAAIGVSRVAVRQRLFRARARLRKEHTDHE